MGNKVRFTRRAHRTTASCLAELDIAASDNIITAAELRRIRRKLELAVRETAIADTALAVGDMLMKGVETPSYVRNVISIYQREVDELPALGETA